MTVGETLLKITDYPFAYSIGFTIASIFGYDITNEKVLTLLTLAGLGGTFLLILDPFGWIVRNYFMVFARQDFRKKKTGQIVGEWDYIRSAFYTNAIDLEKDKIVSIVYFIITIFVFLFALGFDTFAKKLVIENNIINCNLDCVRHDVWGAFVFIAFVVVAKLIWNGLKLSKKSNIVATYLFSVGITDIPKESVENISKFIELGDWKTAEYWQNKISEDKKHKRGKRDLIIKGIEKVYRPLHKESLIIEDRCNQVSTGRPYPYLGIDEWNKIQSESDYIYLEDKESLHQIGQFHGMVQDYDYRLGVCATTVNEIILRRASEEFGRKIQRIEYFTDKAGGDTQFRLIDCAILGVHPKEKYQGDPSYADLNFIDDVGHSQNYKTPQSELKNFDVMWEKILVDVEKNESVIKMKQLFQNIQNENQVLKQKYLDKISEEINL